MNKFFFLLLLIVSIRLSAQDKIQPHSITYRCKTLIANSQIVHTKDVDSLIVVFDKGKMFSTMSTRAELTHVTDVQKRIRYSMLNFKRIFRLEKVNQDTTNFKYTYVKLRDTLMWHGYIGYKHKFTMKDNFTGTTYTVVLYECPDIKIDPEYSKYYFSELFILKVPIRLEGAVIKALAEQRIDDKTVSRDELLLSQFNDEADWPAVSFETPIDRNYTMMLPEGSPRDKKYVKELVEDISGRKDYPTIPYRMEFDRD